MGIGWAQPAASYWQQQANYQIQVRLNDTTHSLDGTVSIQYINNSPDTLHFLWIHLWPNAYKNESTAFGEQTLLEGNLDFYFSKADEKGYINRLQFTAHGLPATLKDHPTHIDIAQLQLPIPLLPGQQLQLRTPFHVQLPALFSRSGQRKQFYAVAQWFPKIAMYDADGWHPMPYLSVGEYYSNFGNYDVHITLPDNYVVAATGDLQSAAEKAWMLKKKSAPVVSAPVKKELFKTGKQPEPFPVPASSRKMKTLHFIANNVVDFAWSADKRFIVKHDTCNIANRTIDVWNYVLPEDAERWQQTISFTKRALRFYSQQLGAYPYPQVSVVASPGSEADGMEYPMITLLNVTLKNEAMLDQIIAHEVGHNWLQGILASNERNHAWMDEGMNTFVERKYMQTYYQHTNKGAKVPADFMQVLQQLYVSRHEDVPIINTPDTVFPLTHYPAVYNKAADWMELLEKRIGKNNMQVLMQQYFQQWQFKHPSPQAFQQMAESVTQSSLQDVFSLLHKTGPLTQPAKKTTKPTGFFSFAYNDSVRYINLAPALGYNMYDKFQVGLTINNYNIPNNKLQFVLTPMFATGSKTITGYGRIGYHWFGKGAIKRFELYSGLARFNTNDGIDSVGGSIYSGFSKIAPGIQLQLKPRNSLSTLQRTIDFRTFIISEQQLSIGSPPPPGDTLFYSRKNGSVTTIIPQLTFTWAQQHKLYPWSVALQVQQVKDIVRSSITAKYFLNYDKTGKGIDIRLFAGKILYLTEKTTTVRNNNSRYHFTMHAPNGAQDYTYSSPFMDRNQSVGVAGRQISMRDGGFKYRSDFSAVVPGLKTNGVDYFDNWLIALNADIDIPNKFNPLSVLPFPTSFKIFADVGTSASPWMAGSTQQKFLYSIGVHLPLLNAIHVYYPVLQSAAFKEPNSVNDPFKAGGPSWWQKRLTFSIDIQALSPKVSGIKFL